MIRIAITGPESSGKSTLASKLTQHLNGAVLVTEYAREFLEKGDGAYTFEDLLTMARKQCQMEDAVPTSARYMVADSELTVYRIWSEEKYGKTDPWILQELNQRTYDLVVLCTPDIPWEEDPLRENPNDRDRLFESYRANLLKGKSKFIIVDGGLKIRLQTLLEAIAEIEKGEH